MTKRTLFTAAGAFLLATGAVFAGRASNKFVSDATQLWYTNGTTGACVASALASTFTGTTKLTTSGNGPAASIKTASGSSRALFANSGCTARVHVNL